MDNDGQLTVSHSELAAWKRCPRRWYLGTYLGYGADPASASPTGSAQLGTRIHTALEAYEGYGIDPLRALEFLYAEAVEERPDYLSELEKEKDLAVAMTEGFVSWAAEEGFDAGYEIVATERETSVTLPFPDHGNGDFRLIAKLDVTVRRLEDEALLLRDYKTVGSLSKANGLPRDTQMKTYSMIQALQAKADASLPRTDGGQYVMLLRSKRTPRAKGPFYAVADFSYNRHDLNATWMRVRVIAGEIREARRALDSGTDHHVAAYPVPGEYCEWMCPFVRICHMMDDGSRWEAAAASNYVKVDPYARYSDNAIDRVRAALEEGRTDDQGIQAR